MRKIRTLGLVSCLCLLDAVPTPGTPGEDEDSWTEQRSTQGARSGQGKSTREQPAESGALPVLPEDLETIEGRITEVISRTRRGEVGGMVDARLRFGTRLTLVRLAPAEFLRRKDFSLKKGDQVSVTGYRMTTVEGKLFVAKEVRKRDRSLHLRDSPGKPVWKKQRSR